jgi:hypothetical protein
MKELDFYMYLFSDGTTAPFEVKGKNIIGIWLVYNKN